MCGYPAPCHTHLCLRDHHVRQEVVDELWQCWQEHLLQASDLQQGRDEVKQGVEGTWGEGGGVTRPSTRGRASSELVEQDCCHITPPSASLQPSPTPSIHYTHTSRPFRPPIHHMSPYIATIPRILDNSVTFYLLSCHSSNHPPHLPVRVCPELS